MNIVFITRMIYNGYVYSSIGFVYMKEKDTTHYPYSPVSEPYRVVDPKYQLVHDGLTDIVMKHGSVFGLCGIFASQAALNMAATKSRVDNNLPIEKYWQQFQDFRLGLCSPPINKYNREHLSKHYLLKHPQPWMKDSVGQLMITDIARFREVIPYIGTQRGLTIATYVYFPTEGGFHTHWNAIAWANKSKDEVFIAGDLTPYGLDCPLAIASAEEIFAEMQKVASAGYNTTNFTTAEMINITKNANVSYFF